MLKVITNELFPHIMELLTYSVGPYPERVRQVIEAYKSSPSLKLFGYETNEQIVGVIGIELLQDKEAIIKHIAVLLSIREQGVGTKMIGAIRDSFELSSVYAETDQEAVNFYKKNGFIIESLGEKYPGVERFLCKLHFDRKREDL